jgi:hypothetical protein
LEDAVFSNCVSLKEIELSEHITEIGSFCFAECSSLRTFSIANPDPSTITLGEEIFWSVNIQDATLYVPIGSKELYANAPVWKEFGKIEDDAATLKTVIELIERRPLAPKTKLDFLQSKVSSLIESDPRKVLSILKDEYLPAKVLIKKGVEKGVISWRNDLYYLREDGHPLCEMGENSTLNNAAKYLTSPKNQDLKFTLEAKVKE